MALPSHVAALPQRKSYLFQGCSGTAVWHTSTGTAVRVWGTRHSASEHPSLTRLSTAPFILVLFFPPRSLVRTGRVWWILALKYQHRLLCSSPCHPAHLGKAGAAMPLTTGTAVLQQCKMRYRLVTHCRITLVWGFLDSVLLTEWCTEHALIVTKLRRKTEKELDSYHDI